MNPEQQRTRFAEIYDRHRSRLSRFCRISAWDGQQDDLLQEIWINIWNSLDRYRGDCSLDTWVVRVAVNSALMFRRSQGRRSRHLARNQDVDRLAAPATAESELVVDEKLHEQLYHCVAQLQVRERMIVSLHLEGLSHGEIAQVIGIGSGHIGVLLHRLKPVLKKCINGEQK